LARVGLTANHARLVQPGAFKCHPLSLHDALPILQFRLEKNGDVGTQEVRDKIAAILRQLPQGMDPPLGSWRRMAAILSRTTCVRSEEHTSELQSLRHLVCRPLLDKNKVTIVRSV